MRVVVSGSNGLVGSEVCTYLAGRGGEIHGIDNNQRAVFFGPEADTRWNQQRLESQLPSFTHHELDVRDRTEIDGLVRELRPDAIIHAAGQPSHDRAAHMPFDDFDTNAVGTLNLLEAARRFAKDAPFVFLSTNKVYGDAPNRIALREDRTRWEYDDATYHNGIPETLSVDQCTHSLFGASKLAADVLVQEYGRYFGMRTCCLRCGCITGPQHAGVELHGFLSYVVRCNLSRRLYKIYGYKGKQVRDNIHSIDVARFVGSFLDAPRRGEVYNLGGGKGNSCSMLEAFAKLEVITGQKMAYEYLDKHRLGDHICYYSDLQKIKAHYPDWSVSVTLDQILVQIVTSWQERLSSVPALQA